MEKLKMALLFIFIAIFIGACSQNIDNNISQIQNAHTDRLEIVATLFPHYDFTKQIAGDKAKVSLILPPGADSHTFEPTPKEVINIYESDIFIYTGDELEPWAAKIVSGAKDSNLLIINCSENIDLIKSNHDEELEEEHEDEQFDPHIWLDPTISIEMVNNIEKVLCQKDPTNSLYYKQNAEKYRKELYQLDKDFEEMIKNSKKGTLVFGGRFSYAYFLNRYGLDYKSAYDSCSAEAEPSISKITSIIDYVKQNDIKVIYHEELVEPKVANSIAEQTGAEALMFKNAHNIKKSEYDSNITYIDIMRENMINIEKGLN